MSFYQVNCEFDSLNICQKSLEYIVLNSEADIVTKWTSEDTLPETLELQIQFKKEAFVRYIYTAWNINEVSIDGEVITNGKVPWSPQSPSSNARMRMITLPGPYLTKSMTLSLTKGTDQFLTKFQVGGCKEEMKSFEDLHVIFEDTVFYIGSSSANIEGAKSSCNEGNLAKIDSDQKLEAVRKLTKSNPNMTFVIGKRFEIFHWFHISAN